MVLLHTKKSYSNNSLLPSLTRGAYVEKPLTARSGSWNGGAVLAPWPTEEVLASLNDQLSRFVSKVCVIAWTDEPYERAWLAGHHAVDLISGQVLAADTRQSLDPVVIVAMRCLSAGVNHNNGLVSYYEKAYAVRTLKVLVQGGYAFEVDDLCAWALMNGFSQREVPTLRKYATQVLAGKSFRLQENVGPRASALVRWKAKADQQAQ